MNKKVINALVLSLMVTSLGMVSQPSATYAKTKGFVWLKTKDYSKNPPIYMANTPGRSVVMWNWNHTKKLHNLRNYPYTKWRVMKSIKMYNPKKTWGNKTGIYYKLVNGSKFGYVHRNFVNKVKTHNSGNSSSSQKIPNVSSVVAEQNKTILSLFTGTIYLPNKIIYPENTESYKASTTTIYPSNASLTLFDQVLNHEMTYKDYILSVLKERNINPLNYKGKGINVSSYDPYVKYSDGSQEDFSEGYYMGGEFVISISPLAYWH